MNQAPALRLPLIRLDRSAPNFSCAQCRFYFPLHADAANLKAPPAGLCKRNPPTLLSMMQVQPNGQVASGVVASNPQVPAENWCGEFSRRSGDVE